MIVSLKLCKKIFIYGDIQTPYTPDEKLNILIYLTLSYIIIYGIYTTHMKMIRFLAHPVCNGRCN